MNANATRLFLLVSLFAAGGAASAGDLPVSRFSTFESERFVNADRYFTNVLQYSVRRHGEVYWRLSVGKDLPLAPSRGKKPARAGGATCLKPWLRCTAFGSVETRLVGYNVLPDSHRFLDEPINKRRAWVSDVVLGLRLDFPGSRTGLHGPWFMQFKVSRHAPELRSSIPVPRQTFAAATVGTEF